MFDMSKLPQRYFDVKFKNGLLISVECPKLKTLRRITDITKDKGNELKNLKDALSMALSKNKQGREIKSDFIEENFNFDEISALLTAYFEWVKNIKNSPN